MEQEADLKWKQWNSQVLDDEYLKAELESIAGNEKEISDRFSVSWSLGWEV